MDQIDSRFQEQLIRTCFLAVGAYEDGYSVITIQFFLYAAIFSVTCIPAFVTSVISISRLNLSHLPVVKSETRD